MICLTCRPSLRAALGSRAKARTFITVSNDALMVSTASCFERAIFRRVRLCQGPSLTLSHKILGTAAVLGFVFTAAHPVAVLVTVLHDGAAWGVTAWSLNVAGYLAGVGFAFLCQEVSNKEATEEVKRMAFWILVWSSITFGVRVLDILMLTGAVVIEEIYHTPQAPTLYANIVSEIVVAFPYAALALLGSARFLRDNGRTTQKNENIITRS